MSLNVMSARSVRRLNREHGCQAVNAAVDSGGRVVLVTAVWGHTFWLNRRSGRVGLCSPGSFARAAFTRPAPFTS